MSAEYITLQKLGRIVDVYENIPVPIPNNTKIGVWVALILNVLCIPILFTILSDGIESPYLELLTISLLISTISLFSIVVVVLLSKFLKQAVPKFIRSMAFTATIVTGINIGLLVSGVAVFIVIACVSIICIGAIAWAFLTIAAASTGRQ